MLSLALFALYLLPSSYGATLLERQAESVTQPGTYQNSNPQAVNPPVFGPTGDLNIVNRVISPDGYSRSTTLAGGTFPGPLIKGNKGDKFEINVINNLVDDNMLLSTTVHWHGISQNGTNYGDGVAFVTQCPIAANDSYLYQFQSPNQAGTFWYHSHLGTQYCDGLRGPLVIYDPNDPYADMYDVDDETTILTLADWYHPFAQILQQQITGAEPNSTLINGLGRYTGGPESPLAVINVEYGKRYRFRLLDIACSSYFNFSIDSHTFTVIESDANEVQPVVADEITLYSAQRYSFILEANQTIDNYWIRAPSNLLNDTFVGGVNVAILRYNGAPIQDPTSVQTPSTMPLQETDLHPLTNPSAPGTPGVGNADINMVIQVGNTGGHFTMNNVSYVPPNVPALLQILSGAVQATDILPTGSVITFPPNKVIEIYMPATTAAFGNPHPMHLHGHNFNVIRSASSSEYNYENPVRRDTVNIGEQGDNVTIRFVTDNSGPWFLHCHIDWHLQAGFAIVFAENPNGTRTHLGSALPEEWDNLCPIYNALSPDQL